MNSSEVGNGDLQGDLNLPLGRRLGSFAGSTNATLVANPLQTEGARWSPKELQNL